VGEENYMSKTDIEKHFNLRVKMSYESKEDTFYTPIEHDEGQSVDQEWDGDYPGFGEYTGDVDATDSEGRSVYNVRLIEFCIYDHHCDCVIQPADGQYYFLECRSWYIPDLDNPLCYISIIRGEWCMNFDVWEYGTSDDD
jgi:hypothetical protein